MKLDIRSVRPDEFRTFLETCEAAFGFEVTDEDVERFRRIISPDRMFAAFDDDVMVGTVGAFPFSLTVPGGESAASGVTMAGVLPSHRRRGVLSGLMQAQFADARERQEPLAVLWASEGSIYGRFGYGLATRQCEMSIERDRAVFQGSPPREGRTRLVDTEEAGKVVPDVYERVRRSTPGMFVRTPSWWQAHTLADPEHERRGGGPMFRVVWENEGGAEAYALYRLHGSWEDGLPASWLQVIEAVATSPTATREIWRFLFGVDLVARVRTHFLALQHPLFHMVSEPRRLRLAVKDGLWLRVVDVPAALEARKYALDGSLTLELSDHLCPDNGGRWRLEVSGSRAHAEPTTARPDLQMTVADLGAVYLGGVGFLELAAAGRVRELSNGSALKANLMFTSEVAPWCAEVF